mmetsp:Transcript_93954/g.262933  ORF Transcript_93954/g.262933 Transcript_93954/m.262933 type:complete len:486 (-) Transcript_93954:27-1484(-)
MFDELGHVRDLDADALWPLFILRLRRGPAAVSVGRPVGVDRRHSHLLLRVGAAAVQKGHKLRARLPHALQRPCQTPREAAKGVDGQAEADASQEGQARRGTNDFGQTRSVLRVLRPHVLGLGHRAMCQRHLLHDVLHQLDEVRPGRWDRLWNHRAHDEVTSHLGELGLQALQGLLHVLVEVVHLRIQRLRYEVVGDVYDFPRHVLSVQAAVGERIRLRRLLDQLVEQVHVGAPQDIGDGLDDHVPDNDFRQLHGVDGAGVRDNRHPLAIDLHPTRLHEAANGVRKLAMLGVQREGDQVRAGKHLGEPRQRAVRRTRIAPILDDVECLLRLLVVARALQTNRREQVGARQQGRRPCEGTVLGQVFVQRTSACALGSCILAAKLMDASNDIGHARNHFCGLCDHTIRAERIPGHIAHAVVLGQLVTLFDHGNQSYLPCLSTLLLFLFRLQHLRREKPGRHLVGPIGDCYRARTNREGHTNSRVHKMT